VNEGPVSLRGRRWNRKGGEIYVEGKERKMREARIDGK